MAKNPAPSRVHSPMLYFNARLRFACSPAPLRYRAGQPPPSPVVGVDLEGGIIDFSAREEQKGWAGGPKREEGKGKPARGGRERLRAAG
uniref:Uncharacterized protein n=3 Tax=Oryza TaxID=4527 RepID=A0A1V1H664_ORYSJ|nr:hypothetical protein [Oryza sativa Japonica Group]BAX24603.1 hypothetical protein [Oryza sativa Indica Group]BAX24699.1 hypothetical protein [Oryza rufipogon]